MSESADTKQDLVPITIDGISMEVEPGTLVIRAAEEIGVTIPRFCDHPLLDPVAACRQCLVDVEGARKPTPACSERVRPDMVIRTQETSEVAREYQESQMELLLVNHPPGLSAVRQGRGVSTAGPGAGPRSRRVPDV